MIKPIIGIGSDVEQKKGDRERAFAYTTYVESLRRAGAVPVVIPPQPENAEAIAEGLDGIVLAGGDDCDPTVYGGPWPFALADVTAPVEIWHGRSDPAAPFAFAERAAAELPRATLHALDDEGHFVFHSHADEIAASIAGHAC